MSFRRRFIALSVTWIVVLSGVLTAALLGYRDRMPDPLASHWGPSGAPDSSMSYTAFVATAVVPWLVLAVTAVAVGITGGRWQRRPVRAWVGAALAGGGLFFAGLAGLTVWANLDVAEWRDARTVNWQAVVVILAALAAGALGWLVARRGPDVPLGPPAGAGQVRPLHLRPGEHTVWVSAASNTWLHGIAIGMLVLAAATAAGAAIGLPRWMLSVSAGLALVTVACLALSSIRVEVNERGLTIAYGAWRWPRRRTPVENIEEAWTEQVRPSEAGGWGYRGLPGNATIMIRGGECLAIRYRSGGRLRISVDDAEQGAALLNALIRQNV